MTIQELRKKIEDREVMCGTLACIPDPTVTETMALSGAEMLWIDMEHTPVSVDRVQNMLIASRSGNVPAFVRIPWNDPVLAKPVLDMGPEGIIFPCIRTKEEAELPDESFRLRKSFPDGIYKRQKQRNSCSSSD